jgi:hypothetical protein
MPRPELPFLEPLGRLAPWIPRLLGIHLGVSLLSLAVQDAYLAPNLSLADVPGGRRSPCCWCCCRPAGTGTGRLTRRGRRPPLAIFTVRVCAGLALLVYGSSRRYADVVPAGPGRPVQAGLRPERRDSSWA